MLLFRNSLWRLHSGGLVPTANAFGLARNADPIAKVVPERDGEFGGGAHQFEECVAAVAASRLRVPPLILSLVTWNCANRPHRAAKV